MKKFMLAFLLLMLSIAPIKKSEAALTFVTGPAGEAFFVASMLPLGYGLYTLQKEKCELALCADKLLGIVSMAVGIVLLEDDRRPTIALSSLTGEQADLFGLTENELKSVNGSIEEINFLKDDIALSLMKIKNPTQLDVDLEWEKRIDDLEIDAFNGVSKIRQYYAQ